MCFQTVIAILYHKHLKSTCRRDIDDYLQYDIMAFMTAYSKNVTLLCHCLIILINNNEALLNHKQIPIEVVYIIKQWQIFLENISSALCILKENWKGQVSRVFNSSVTGINKFWGKWEQICFSLLGNFTPYLLLLWQHQKGEMPSIQFNLP